MKKINQRNQFIIFLVILMGCWGLGRLFSFDIESFRKCLEQFPLSISGLIFVLLYVGLTSIMWVGPKDILRVLSAILFGPSISTILVLLGEMGNAFIFFHISRKLGREYVIKKFSLKEKHLNQTEKNTGVLGMFTLRINPLVPFRFLDLGMGLTKVSFGSYFIAIILGSPSRIFFQQYILSFVGEDFLNNPMLSLAYLNENQRLVMYAGFYLLGVFLLSLVVGIRKMKKNNSK